MASTGLKKWFKEKWVDVSRKDKDGKHPPCGRSKAKKGSKGYPKCRGYGAAGLLCFAKSHYEIRI